MRWKWPNKLKYNDPRATVAWRSLSGHSEAKVVIGAN